MEKRASRISQKKKPEKISGKISGKIPGKLCKEE